MARINSLRNYFWSFANSGGSQIIGFLSTVLIARIASPADFGIIAICTSVILISNILSEAGLASTIIVNKEFCVKKASTIVITISTISILLFFVVVGLAGVFAKFFQQNSVNEILPLMALTILANGLRSVHGAVLIRRLKFRKLAFISLFSASIGSSIGVISAYLYDPLIGLMLVFTLTPITNTVMLWLFAPWGFCFYFKPKLLYSDIRFSLNVALSSFLDQASKSTLVFLLNGRFGVIDLGFYSRADAIKNLTTQTIDKVVQKVSFPILSKKNHEGSEKAIKEHIKISTALILILIPLTYIFINYSESIINLIYGPNWSASAQMLELIAYVGIFMTLTSQNLTLFKSLGYSEIMTWNKGIGLILLPVVFLVIDSMQILVIINGIVIYSVILFFVSLVSFSILKTKETIIYMKYIFGASILSITVIFIHYFFLGILIENPFFNLLINGLLLFLIIVFLCYVFYFFYRDNQDV